MNNDNSLVVYNPDAYKEPKYEPELFDIDVDKIYMPLEFKKYEINRGKYKKGDINYDSAVNKERADKNEQINKTNEASRNKAVNAIKSALIYNREREREREKREVAIKELKSKRRTELVNKIAIKGEELKRKKAEKREAASTKIQTQSRIRKAKKELEELKRKKAEEAEEAAKREAEEATKREAEEAAKREAEEDIDEEIRKKIEERKEEISKLTGPAANKDKKLEKLDKIVSDIKELNKNIKEAKLKASGENIEDADNTLSIAFDNYIEKSIHTPPPSIARSLKVDSYKTLEIEKKTYDGILTTGKGNRDDNMTYMTLIYKAIINKGLELINGNDKLVNLYDKVLSYVVKLNDLYIAGKDYIIENGVLTQELVDKTEKDTKFLQITVARKKIADYWKQSEIELKVSEEDNDPEVNTIITNINAYKKNIFDKEIKDEDLVEEKRLLNVFSDEKNNYINKFNSLEYISSLEQVFFEGDIEKRKELYDTLKEKIEAYLSPGKTLEYDQCGPRNKDKVKILYGKDAEVNITDQIVNNILTEYYKKPSGKGSTFCIDNYSTDGKFLSEAKSYSSIDYTTWYNLNIGLKKVYYDKLMAKTKDIIRDLRDINEKLEVIEEDLLDKKNTPERLKVLEKQKEELETQKKELTKILEYNRDVLMNKNMFDLDFYKNEDYMGVGIKMTKFSPIEYPVGFLDTKTEEQKEDYLNLVKAKKENPNTFTPITTNTRQITKITMNFKEDKKEDKKLENKKLENYFNKEFNEQIGVSESNPFDYYITVEFSKVMAVYDYTHDNNISWGGVPHNLVLLCYKLSQTFDQQKPTRKTRNGVCIPIEKFIVKKATRELRTPVLTPEEQKQNAELLNIIKQVIQEAKDKKNKNKDEEEDDEEVPEETKAEEKSKPKKSKKTKATEETRTDTKETTEEIIEPDDVFEEKIKDLSEADKKKAKAARAKRIKEMRARLKAEEEKAEAERLKAEDKKPKFKKK